MAGGFVLYAVMLSVVLLTNSSQASEAVKEKDEGIYLEIITTSHPDSDNTYTKTIRSGLSASLAGMNSVTGLAIKVSDPYSMDGVYYQLASVLHGENSEPQLAMEIEGSPPRVSGQISPDTDLSSNLSLSWDFTNYQVGRSYKCVATGDDRAGQIVTVSKTQIDDSDLGIGAAEVNVIMSVTTKLTDGVTKTAEKQTEDIGERIDGLETKLDTLSKSLENFQQMSEKSQDSTVWFDTWATRFDFSTAYKHKMYMISKTLAPFNIGIADQTCQRAGGYLVELDDNEEFNFVRDLVMSIGGNPHFFTGTNDIVHEGVFVHKYSGKRLEINQWYRGEPNDSNGGEDCVQIRPDLNGYNV